MKRNTLRKSRRIIALNTPTSVQVEAGAYDTPRRVRLDRRTLSVSEIQESWRIDDEWWRTPIARLYHCVVLEDDRIVTLYRDLHSGEWFLQR